MNARPRVSGQPRPFFFVSSPFLERTPFRFPSPKKNKKKPRLRSTAASLNGDMGSSRRRGREKMAIPLDRISDARTSWRRVNLTLAIRSPRPPLLRNGRNGVEKCDARSGWKRGGWYVRARRAANPKGEGCARYIYIYIKIHEPSTG